MDTTPIIQEIDTLWNLHLEVRATFPNAKTKHVGLSKISSSSYYTKKGFNYELNFPKPLQEEDIIRLRHLGHWLNQSFLIRLYSILEHGEIVGQKIKIDKDLSGNEELDILRRLRNAFGHTSAYNPHDGEKAKLFKRIVKHFNLSDPKPDELPIPIDQVIEPIYIAIKKYVKEKVTNIPSSSKSP